MRAALNPIIAATSILFTALMMAQFGIWGFFPGAGFMSLAIWLAQPKKPLPTKEEKIRLRAEIVRWEERVWDSAKDGFAQIICYKLVLQDETGKRTEYIYESSDLTHCGDPRIKELFDAVSNGRF